MAKKFIVDLNEAEKAELVTLTQKGRPGARKIKRANILLLANAGKPDFEIAELLHTSWLTVLRTRHRFVEGNLDFALSELPRAGRLPKIDDKVKTISNPGNVRNGVSRPSLVPNLSGEWKMSWICTPSLISQPFQ